MTRTDSEQELVLGNKQLLSAFFVVVALLGVFFTMGYIIGRNSAGPVKAASANTSTDSDAASRTPAAARDVPPAPAPATDSAGPAEPPHIATDTPAETRPVTPEPKAPVEEEKKPARAVKSEAASDAAVTQSVPGHQYLQVMAVKRPMADSIVKVLKERGFPALLGESSRPELFRVLVGPYPDMPTLAEAKTKLKAAGFDSVISK